MAVSLTGAGGCFTRLGHLGGGYADIIALMGAAATARVLAGAKMTTRLNTLVSDYNAGTAINSTIDGLAAKVAAFQITPQTFLSQLATYAANTVIRMVDDDVGLSAKTLTAAWTELIAQMVGTADSFAQGTFSFGAQANVGTPDGNPKIALESKNGYGVALQFLYDEILTFKTILDAQAVSSPATAGQETMSIKGQATVAKNSYLWPAGSGANTTAKLVNGDVNYSSSLLLGNLLQNSSFSTYTTANHPDNWTKVVGAAGTDFQNGGSAYRTGGGSLRFNGDGATLPTLTQAFNTAPSTTVDAGGTSSVLLPLTSYALNCWIKTNAAPAAGVLEFSLINGSGTTIADEAGTNNLFTQSLTAIDTTYTNVQGIFRLPSAVPSTVKLKMRTSTAITNTHQLHISLLSLAKMVPVYTGGPPCAIFCSSTDTTTGDAFTRAITATMGSFLALFERWFNMASLGLQPPISGAPTVADSLIS